MAVSWEYIKRRRKWTSELILLQLEDRSFKNFQLFFSERDIECPSEEEYNAAIKNIQPPKVIKKTKSAIKKTVKTRQNRSRKAKKEI